MLGVKLIKGEAESRNAPVQENMPVQQRLWLCERVGLWVMLLIIVLTLAGLFSKGLLSSTDISSVDGRLSIQYERFLRNGATSLLVIDIQGKPGATLPLSIAGELLDGLTVESVTPPVERAATYGTTGMHLQLLADAEGHTRVHLAVRADGLGLYRSQIHNGASSIRFSQFIYP